MNPSVWRRGAAAAMSAAIAVVAAASPAAARGDDNHVFVGNDRDGASRGHARAEIRFDRDGVVDNENVAVALASCVDCRTLAIALQGVVVVVPPSQVTPRNEATAVNVECESCLTGAFARQVVVQVDGPVELTDAGHQRFAALRRELHAIVHGLSTLDVATLNARVSAAEDELVAILTTELERADGDEHEDRRPGRTVDDAEQRDDDAARHRR
jgi:putative peptide zinc metalloprotease protein